MAHFERSSLTMGVTVTGRVSTQYNFGKTRIYIYIYSFWANDKTR